MLQEFIIGSVGFLEIGVYEEKLIIACSDDFFEGF